MFKIVFLVLCVLCVVNTQSDDGCKHSRSYTRVKRGKYYPGPPLRFYSRPPLTFPIKGPFSYTPPPFMLDDEPTHPGSRPYKVSKRPTNEGLGNDDINNLIKHLSKQDLDKIIEFANEKNKYSDKNKVMDYDYIRPHKKENPQRPTYTKDFYKSSKYDEEKPFETEFKKYVNYVTEATPMQFAPQDDRRNTYPLDTASNQIKYYGPQDDGAPPNNEYALDGPTQFKRFPVQDDRSTEFAPQEVVDLTQVKEFGFRAPGTQYETYMSQENLGPVPVTEESLPSPNVAIPETAEIDKLPPPDNMREIDYDVSFTNNVPTVVKGDSSSYQVENFGDLPLMNYNSKLHSVSSYHVPHYTVTQPKPHSKPSSTTSSSYTSAQSYSSSSSLLKPSPASASIKVPPVVPAPPPSAAKEQSDAHLKAIKIWSHKSKGAAYTLHDDGTLTPEWPRPKYV